MSIPTYKVPSKGYIKQGDTISKKTVTFGGDYAGDFTTATIKMQVYNGNIKVIDITNGSGITVISNRIFEIDEVSAPNNNLPDKCILIGDLQITEADSVVTTYFNVEYTVIKEYTT
tara:strand:+ start:1186 stop:1533 length:348 start_codon:yes stop_codon:yes gene_type:complete